MKTIFSFLIFLFLALSSANAMDLELANEENKDKSTMSAGYNAIDRGKNKQDEFTVQPVQKHVREHELIEIDRDLFASRSQGCPTIIQVVRIFTVIAVGILVSMPATAQNMILVGDWIGATEDTTSASFLAAYLGIMFAITVANVWDDWTKGAGEYLNPAYKTCPTCTSLTTCTFRDKKEIEVALIGKYPTTMAKKSNEYYCLLGILTLSAAAYAFPWLWQSLYSIEFTDFTTLGYFTMPLYFLTLARLFFSRAKENITTIPSSEKAANEEYVLIDSVKRFQRKVKEDPELRDQVYKAIKAAQIQETDEKVKDEKVKEVGITINTPLISDIPLAGNINTEDEFLLSYLFLVHNSADKQYGRDAKMVIKKHTEEIRDPLYIYWTKRVESMINGGLGIGWMAMSTLLQKSYQSTFIKFGINPVAAYDMSLTLACFQALSFMYATNNICHHYGQSLVKHVLVPLSHIWSNMWSSKATSEDMDKKCFDMMKTLWLGVKRAPIWVIGKMPSVNHLASGIVLSLPALKRGLDANVHVSYPEKLVWGWIPFFLETMFFTSRVEANLNSVYRKIVTNLPNRCMSLFDCCRYAHEEEFLEELGDDTIVLIKNLNKNTRKVLHKKLIQRKQDRLDPVLTHSLNLDNRSYG